MSKRKATAFEPGHGYTQEDGNEVSDSSELTAEDLAKARPLAEVFPHLADAIAAKAAEERRRGPQKAPTKRPVSIRLDADVIETLRAGGAGWQSRANDILRKGLRLKRG